MTKGKSRLEPTASGGYSTRQLDSSPEEGDEPAVVADAAEAGGAGAVLVLEDDDVAVCESPVALGSGQGRRGGKRRVTDDDEDDDTVGVWGRRGKRQRLGASVPMLGR